MGIKIQCIVQWKEAPAISCRKTQTGDTGSNPVVLIEERVTSFRASRTFIDLHLLLAARMILLRTEHDRPAVFIEHLSHCARLSVKTLKSCTALADIKWTLDSGGIGRRYSGL